MTAYLQRALLEAWSWFVSSTDSRINSSFLESKTNSLLRCHRWSSVSWLEITVSSYAWKWQIRRSPCNMFISLPEVFLTVIVPLFERFPCVSIDLVTEFSVVSLVSFCWRILFVFLSFEVSSKFANAVLIHFPQRHTILGSYTSMSTTGGWWHRGW